MNALIVDDDAVSRIPLAAALTELRHEVHQAVNAREAWAAWRSGGELIKSE